MAKKVKLKVYGLIASQVHTGAYALILVEENGSYRIPIIVGAIEAQAIAIVLEHIVPPRPLTHDLFTTFTHSFGILLQEVYIYKFLDGIFYAEMVLFDGERQVRIDCRTSDAIAIALRLQADIYTTDDIVKECGLLMDDANQMATDTEESYLLDDLYPDENDDTDPDCSANRITPASFRSEEKLNNWLATLSLDSLRKRLQQAIEDENYEHAKIYKDELNRREKD